MAAIETFTTSIDGTIPVSALMYDDEELIGSQDGVGIYDGQQKSPNHQSGTVHVSSHRLFYVDAQKKRKHSFVMDLSSISQTEYYAGLFKSSAKVTLHLFESSNPKFGLNSNVNSGSWECEVCAYRNPPGPSPSAARVCALCGVPRTSQHLSASFPSSASASSTSVSVTEPPSNSCLACTFINHPSLRACELCGTELPPRIAQSAPASRPMTPADLMIKLSFRQGGDKTFYSLLKRSLQSKDWGSVTLSPPQPANRSGISGIIRDVENSAEGRKTDMNDSLKDLEVFMIKAKNMVKLAADLNERLTTVTNTTSTEPEEATFIRSSLSQLGLQMTNAPVTQDMVKDERRWIEGLGKELVGILEGGLMKNRGIIALDEVWGGWNRARGVALIPPSTLLQVLPSLPIYSSPSINVRTLSSGLMVLHTPPYSHVAFSARLSGSLNFNGPMTTRDIAVHEELGIGLVQEMVEAVEVDGAILRDDPLSAIKGGGEMTWWANTFANYSWDGQS